MALLQTLTIPIRIAQALLAVIVLGLTAYAADWRWWWSTPSEISFLLFTSVWTLLMVVYLVFAPIHFPAAAHKFAILGVEAVTTIFWFAGFVALASFIGDVRGCSRVGVCRASIAAVIFAAFEWILFMVTAVTAGLQAWRSKGNGVTKQDPAVNAQAPYAGA